MVDVNETMVVVNENYTHVQWSIKRKFYTCKTKQKLFPCTVVDVHENYSHVQLVDVKENFTHVHCAVVD